MNMHTVRRGHGKNDVEGVGDSLALGPESKGEYVPMVASKR
jgi:hypothetical protein